MATTSIEYSTSPGSQKPVYVLHCFVKKTQATRKADLELGQMRFSELVRARKSK